MLEKKWKLFVNRVIKLMLYILNKSLLSFLWMRVNAKCYSLHNKLKLLEDTKLTMTTTMRTTTSRTEKKMFNLKTGHINCQLKRKFGCAFPSNSFWLFFLSFKKFPHKNVFVFHIFWFGISFTLVSCHSFSLGLFVIFFISRSFSFLSITQTFAISLAVLFFSYLSKNWKKIAKVSFIWTHAI